MLYLQLAPEHDSMLYLQLIPDHVLPFNVILTACTRTCADDSRRKERTVRQIQIKRVSTSQDTARRPCSSIFWFKTGTGGWISYLSHIHELYR